MLCMPSTYANPEESRKNLLVAQAFHNLTGVQRHQLMLLDLLFL